VHVTIDGKPTGPGTATPGGRVKIPITVTDLGCGPHTVAVRPDTGAAASTRLLVTCQVLTATPSRFNGHDLPPTTRVDGHGFDPGAVVVVSVPGGPSVTTTTDRHGGFRTPFPTASLPCGGTVLTGVERTRLAMPPSASTPLAVSCPPYTPSLKVTPGAASGGDVVTVKGLGYHGNSLVRVVWTYADQTPAIGTAVVRTDRTGAFTASLLVLVHDRLGPRDVTATDTQGAMAKAPVRVVPGSVQPGRHQTIVESRRDLLSRR
jgi:hypothetical protein